MLETFSLDELCTLITDGAHYSPKFCEGGIPMYSVKDMTDQGFSSLNIKTISQKDYSKLKSAGCEPLDDDILIAKDGSVMKHVLKYRHEKNCVLLSSIAILRPNKDIIDPDYLVYSILNSYVKKNIIKNYVSGSGVPRIVLKDFKTIKLKILDLKLQKNVSIFLNRINKKIKINKEINQNLKNISKKLFKSWFVDFDLVNKNSKKKTNVLFPDSFENCEIGKIPKGWKVNELSKILSFKNGNAFKSKDWKDEGVPVVKIRNIKPSILDMKECSFISEDLAKENEEFLLSRGDILIGMTGYVGEVCLVPKLKKMPFFNQRVGKIIPMSKYLLPFIFSMMIQSNFKKKIEELSQGSAQQNVSSSDILKIKYIHPPENLIKSFSDLISSNLDKFLNNHEENLILINLKDILLPKLISGEIKFLEAEKLIDEASV
jgi:type I restriction enzyme, S subunit